MVQGFKNEYGIDYEDTFAPVAKMTIVRIMSQESENGRWQMDVKNAFLHGDLQKTVYMKHLPTKCGLPAKEISLWAKESLSSLV